MSSTLDRMLQIAEGIEKGDKKKQNNAPSAQRTPKRMGGTLSEQVSHLDKMVYGPYIPTQQEKEAWNADKGYDALKEMQDKNEFASRARQTNMPSAIVESMIENPCNYTPEMLQESRTPVDNMVAKLADKYGKTSQSGIDNVRTIMGRLDEDDKKRASEGNANVSTNGVIDYSLIKTIVESVVDARLSSIQQLNESKGGISPRIKLMQLTEQGTFRFLDTEDNVYECQMKFLGKKKRKK